jgi:diacylglycerol kinase family enzyme
MIELSNSTKILTGSQRISNIITLIGQLFQRKSFKLEFCTECEKIKENVMSVCIGNTLGYGQTPNAVPYNGMFDMSVITRPEWWQLFHGFWLLGKGRFLNYKNVHPYRINSAVFTDIGKAKVSLDGRILQFKNITPVTVSVLYEKISLIIP